jgi:hypothetical protein
VGPSRFAGSLEGQFHTDSEVLRTSQGPLLRVGIILLYTTCTSIDPSKHIFAKRSEDVSTLFRGGSRIPWSIIRQMVIIYLSQIDKYVYVTLLLRWARSLYQSHMLQSTNNYSECLPRDSIKTRHCNGCYADRLTLLTTFPIHVHIVDDYKQNDEHYQN